MDLHTLSGWIHTWLLRGEAWIDVHVLTFATLGQLGLLVLTCLLAVWLRTRLQGRLLALARTSWLSAFSDLSERAVVALTMPLVWLLLAWLALLVAQAAGVPGLLLDGLVTILAAWITIRFTSLWVRDAVWSKFIAVTAWILATLSILDLLAPVAAMLDSAAVQLGHLRLSALLVIKGVISMAVFLWLAVLASQLLERRIRNLPTLTPSIQVLISKLMKIVLIAVAIVGALGIMGIDLTAFTVFTGAVGVGVGFGLQKVVSNLVSGVILLLDKSVKPGDVVSVGDTYGWINSLGARYVSVITREGKEHLIPNEDLITQQVINWSYSNNEVRLALPVGIAYDSDVRLAMRLCVEAAAAIPRVLRQPAPDCLLQGFGDSSVDLVLRIWINDPQHGLAPVRSEAYLAIWDRFRAHGIQIPFPQRDLHLQAPARVRVVMEQDAPDAADEQP